MRARNSAVGRNYGVEVTLARPFSNGFLFHLTASLYQSQYKGSDGVRRSTDLNGTCTFNMLLTKEWSVGSRSMLTIGMKTSFAGGRRYGVIDYKDRRNRRR